MGLACGSGDAAPEPLSCAAEVSLTILTKSHDVVKMLKLDGRSYSISFLPQTKQWRPPQKAQTMYRGLSRSPKTPWLFENQPYKTAFSLHSLTKLGKGHSKGEGGHGLHGLHEPEPCRRLPVGQVLPLQGDVHFLSKKSVTLLVCIQESRLWVYFLCIHPITLRNLLTDPHSHASRSSHTKSHLFRCHKGSGGGQFPPPKSPLNR